MKIIDEKGRIFGKINVIDFLVILFLLFLMPVFYFGYKVLIKRPMLDVQERGFIELEINCRLIKLKPELLKMISVGERELDENGEVIGEIISLGQSGPYKYEFNIGEQKIIEEDPILKQVEAKLKLRAEDINSKPYYKDKEIKIDSPLEFKTDNFTLIAIPFEEPVEAPEREFIEIEINCRLIKLNPELLKMISVGEKELDEDRVVIGEIISLGQSGPYKYEFDIGEQKIIKEDAILKQVEAKLRLRAEDIESKPYYKDMLIEIGSPLEFKTDNFTLIAIPYEEGKEERIINLYVTLIDLDQELLKDISVGDKETDENDNTIAEILSLDRVENSSLTFDLGSDSVVKEEEGAKKQISARMRLKCQVINGSELYFKGEKVGYNSRIEFKTDKYEISGIPILYEEGKEERIINLYVTLIDLDQELLKDISVGDKETDENDKTIAEILSLGRVEDSSLKFDLGSGSIVKEEEGVKKQISARMRLKCQVEDGSELYFKGEKVEHNSHIEFKTDKYEITGLVTLKEKWLKLRVRFSRLDPEVAGFIQKGDIEKDVFGRTIGRIESILSNEPAVMMEAMTDEGEFITLYHPLARDIVVFLDAQCMEKEGTYYYKDDLAKMGIEIVFNTASYSLKGMIVGLKIE